MGFTGVIAQVVAMLGGGRLNDAGEDLGERLRVLAVPSGVPTHGRSIRRCRGGTCMGCRGGEGTIGEGHGLGSLYYEVKELPWTMMGDWAG